MNGDQVLKGLDFYRSARRAATKTRAVTERTRGSHACMAFLLAVAAMFGTVSRAAAATTGLTIYEVDGAGGLAGATYRQDTIILFNSSQSTVACTTCAIQTHSGTSPTAGWTVYKLPSLNIPAGGWYMIAASSPTLSTSGSLSPIPYDYRLKTIEGTTIDGTSGDNILSSTVGEVAITNTQTALTSSPTAPCGTGTQLVDQVGYGSDIGTNVSTTASPAACYLGSGEAFYDGSTAYGRPLGVQRKNRCINSGDNSIDFVNVPPVFYNSQSAPLVCPAGTQLSAVISANPTNPGATENVTFTAAVLPATQPASGSISVYLNFNAAYFGGTALQMYDDGTHGDAKSGDGVYTVATTVPSTTVAGFTYPTNVTVTDNLGNQYIGSTRLTIPVGTFTLSTPNTSQSTAAGGVVYFPITIKAAHGYAGFLNMTCTGTPNTNTLGVPLKTQCVATPNEVSVPSNGTATLSLAIATGTTFSASTAPVSHIFSWLGLLPLGVLGFAIWRRKHLPTALLVAFLAVLALGATGCGTFAGLGDTNAAPGTYSYTVTATDATSLTATNSLGLTVTVR